MKDAKVALLLFGGAFLWHWALLWSSVDSKGPDSLLMFLVELYLPVVLAAFPLLRSFSRCTGKRYLSLPVMLAFGAGYFVLLCTVLGVFWEWGTWGADLTLTLVEWCAGILVALLYLCMFLLQLWAKMKAFDERHKGV